MRRCLIIASLAAVGLSSAWAGTDLYGNGLSGGLNPPQALPPDVVKAPLPAAPETPPAPVANPNPAEDTVSTQVGAMRGDFRVDESGAAAYVIPIATAPSGGSLSPQLALSYHSQSGNGIAGMGWSLGGVSMITRCGQSLESADAANRGVRLDMNDRYCLDGQHLLLVSGAYGANGAEYRTEVDQIAKVQSFGASGNGPSYFKVWRKDGTLSWYGAHSDSTAADTARILSKRPSDSTAYAWALGRIEDSASNYIEFVWVDKQPATVRVETVLDKVRYGGNSRSGFTALAPNNEIRFTYEARPVAETTLGYLAGAELYTSQRLKTVTSLADSLELRRYNLSYRSDGDGVGRSALASIQECNATLCYPATTFNWRRGAMSFNAVSTTTAMDGSLASANHYRGGFAADLNGDGLHDFLYLQRDGTNSARPWLKWWLSSRNSSGVVTMVNGGSIQMAAGIRSDATKLPQIRLADVNADGYSDVIYSYKASGASTGYFYAHLWSGAALGAATAVGSTTLTAASLQVMDWNGDGLSDLLYAQTAGLGESIRVALNQGVSSSLSQRYLETLNFSINYSSTDFPQPGYSLLGYPFITSQLDDRIFDADGDGAVDVVLKLREERCITGCIIPIAPPEPPNDTQVTPPEPSRSADEDFVPDPAGGIGGGNSFYVDRYIAFRAVQTSATHVTLTSAGMVALASGDQHGGTASRADNLRMMDINGDGLGDAFYYSLNSNQWAYRLSTGNGFKSEIKLATTLGLPTDTNIRKQLRLQDVNGDGYPDLLFPNSVSSTTALWRVAYWSWNAGGGYLAAVNTSVQAGHINNGAVTEFADYNGDGKLDALYLRPNNGALEMRRGMGRNTISGSSTYEPAFLIDTFTNGLGARDKAIYKAMTQRSVYSRDRQGPYTGYGRQAATVVYDIVPPHYVVAETRKLSPRYDLNATASASTAALTGETITQYYYTGAKIMGGGRGFIGFHEVASFDPHSSTLERVTHSQKFPYIGSAEDSRRWYLPVGQQPWLYNEGSAALTPCSTCANTAINSSGILLRRVANTWAKRTTTSPGQLPYLSVGEEWHYTPVISAGAITSSSLAFRVKTTNSSVDAYGNVGNIQVDHYTAAGALYQRQTTVNTHTNNATSWRLGRLTATTVQHDRQGGACNFSTSPNPSPQCIQRKSAFVYDTATSLLSQEKAETGDAALALTTSYTLDRFGNRLTTTVSGMGVAVRTTTTSYDSRGRYVVNTSNAYNQIQSQALSFDRYGNPLQIRDQAGVVTTLKYDAMGREYFRYNPTGAWGKVVYRLGAGASLCPTGTAYHAISTSGGAPSNWTCYDLLGREVRRITTALSGSKRQIDTHYDEASRVAEISAPHYAGSTAYWTRTAYDELGRPIFTRLPDNTTTQASYSGLSTTLINPLSQQQTEVRNVLGETLSVTDHLGGVVSYSYDATGNVLVVNGAGGNDNVTLSYDRLGRKISSQDPDKGGWQYQHDALGQLSCQIDGKGQLTRYTYDLLGRETNRQYYASGTLATCAGSGAALTTISHTYNNTTGYGPGKGQLSSQSAAHNGFSYSRSLGYDSFGRPQNATTSMDGRSWSEQQTYDQFGRLFQQFDAAGSELGDDYGVRHVYNSHGHLTQLKEARDGAAGKIYVEYLDESAHGEISQTRYGNGLISNRSYNAASGRLSSIITGANVQDLSYSWNGVGSLTQRRDRSGGRDQTENYTYDGLNRLLTSSLTAPAAGVSNLVTLRMRYDASGNVLCKSDINGLACTGTQTNITYPASGRVHGASSAAGINYTYDANGSVISDSSGRSFSYTPFDRLYQATAGSNWSRYFYASDLNWVKRITQGDDANTASSETVWRIGSVEISEKNGVRELRRTIGGEVQISHWAGVGSVQEYYLHSDHLSSIDVITNASGVVVDSMSFTAFGSRRTSSDWRFNPSQIQLDQIRAVTSKGYSGHEMIDALGIVHMGGRIYDLRLGRFLQADPYVQTPQNSQSLNRYSYVENNPLSYNDPDGFFLKGLFKALANAFVHFAARALLGPVLGSFAAGFILSGGSFKAGFFSAVSAFAANAIGNINFSGVAGFVAKAAVHGLAQGAISKASGGGFKGAFLGGLAGSLSSAIPQLSQDGLVQTLQAAIIGGTVSEISGGGFANGALSATFVALYNHLEHQEASNAQQDLDLTAEEYLEAVENGLWDDAPIIEGYPDDQAVNQAAARTNSAPERVTSDVSADPRYAEFLNQVSRATTRARIPVRGEKFLALAINSEGVVVVKRIAILTGQGGDVSRFIRGAGAIAHVHYRGLVQYPTGADHSAVKFAGISSFVIGSSGSRIWEVGRINGQYKYRTVSGREPGRWRPYQ
ncbi:MAG: hypothetical protein Tsb002_28520 [Wenzhouxiangellaceae bacterium]